MACRWRAAPPGRSVIESTNGHDWTLAPSGSTLELAVIDSAGSQIVTGGDGFIYQRDAKGAYAEVGPGANAITLAANGRFFMAADLGRILSGHTP